MRIVALAIVFGLAGDQIGAETLPDCSGFNSPQFFESATAEEVRSCAADDNFDLFAPGRDGLPPLFHAVRHGTSPDVIGEIAFAAREQDDLDELLGARDRSGRSAMHYAAEFASDPAMLTVLASWDAPVSAGGFSCEEGWRLSRDPRPRCMLPIHLAARRNDGLRHVATLLALGENPQIEAPSGVTPLDFVPRSAPDRADLLALLSKGQWPERPESRPAPGQPRIGPEACATFLTPAFFEQATVADVAHCMGDAIPPTAVARNGNSALHLAGIHADDPGIIDFMMHWLRDHEPGRISAALVQVDGRGRSVLHAVAEQGHDPRMITRLIAWGADPNHPIHAQERSRWNPLRGSRGTTPLHLAARRTDEAREGMVTALLAAGANPRVQDHADENGGGRQALHYAVSRSPDLRVIMLLAKVELNRAGAIQTVRDFVNRASRGRINHFQPVADDKSRTALHVALSANPETGRQVARAGLDVIAYLLRFGFSPDDVDSDGFTPLAYAARYASSTDMFIAVLDASDGDKACQPLLRGVTILGNLRANAALASEERDESGTSMSALEAYLRRCPQ